jgi:predicted dehydrogenase
MTTTWRRDPILVIGYGSVGRRHAHNLLKLGCENVLVYRTGHGVLEPDQSARLRIEHDLDSAFSYRPRAAIIANPTSLHVNTALAAARRGCHLFIEKPVSDSTEHLEELQQMVDSKALVVSVGFQFRFHPGIQRIKAWLGQDAIGPLVSIDACYGEYLPGWHPWEDYRRGYSARAELGGGVVHTLCHPLDYMRWLVGECDAVASVVSARGGLSLDVPDTARILLRFTNGVIGSVSVDFVRRPTEHTFKIVGQRGTITWSNETGEAVLHRADSDVWTVGPPDKFERNDMFLDEMIDFLSCMETGARTACPLSDGIRAVEIASAAIRASKETMCVSTEEASSTSRVA